MIQTCSAPQNDCLNLSFVKDEHTYGKKMAGNGGNIVIYQYLSFPIRLYLLSTYVLTYLLLRR